MKIKARTTAKAFDFSKNTKTNDRIKGLTATEVESKCIEGELKYSCLFSIPKNLDAFFVSVFDEFRSTVQVRVNCFSCYDREEVTNDCIAYILEKFLSVGKFGIERYKTYNPESGASFYTFFFSVVKGRIGAYLDILKKDYKKKLLLAEGLKLDVNNYDYRGCTSDYGVIYGDTTPFYLGLEEARAKKLYTEEEYNFISELFLSFDDHRDIFDFFGNYYNGDTYRKVSARKRCRNFFKPLLECVETYVS